MRVFRPSPAWLILALLGALALSGCAADDPDASDAAMDPVDPTADPTGNITVNAVPVPEMRASATEVDAGSNLTFDLDASDEDGDGLAWTLSLDGGVVAEGDQLPAQVDVAFEEAGNASVVFNVTDGEDGAEERVEIAVLEVEAAPDPVTYSEDVAVNSQSFYVTGSDGCVSWQAMASGVDCVWFELGPEAEGLPFVTESGGDVDVEFRSDCTTASSSVELFGADGQEEGEVPAGAGCAVLADFASAGTLSIIIG